MSKSELKHILFGFLYDQRAKPFGSPSAKVRCTPRSPTDGICREPGAFALCVVPDAEDVTIHPVELRMNAFESDFGPCPVPR